MPQTDRTLDSLAARAGMSRSVFASRFRETVGLHLGASTFNAGEWAWHYA